MTKICDNSHTVYSTPVFPSENYAKLPGFLKEGSQVFRTAREKDVFLTGALTILSGCFPTVKGLYARKETNANLFCFIIAPPASGKGSLVFAKQLGQVRQRKQISKSIQLQEEYDIKLREYIVKTKRSSETAKVELPPRPKTKAFFVPADSSSASVINLLNDNNGNGVMCETEADTMTKNFELDWGGYSDLLRKSFHHETVSRTRMMNNEYLEIEKPKLSVVLSGTPNQVSSLINSTEDGLFSRFLYYTYVAKQEWMDVSVDFN